MPVKQKPTNKVRYAMFTETDEQAFPPHRWVFAIQNNRKPRIREIEQRVLENLSPISDINIIYFSDIPGTKSYGKIYAFSSDKGKIEEPRKVFDANIKRDQHNLREFSDEIIAENYFLNYLARS